MSTTTTVTKKRGARRRSSSIAKAIASFLVIVITTYLGLLAVTFFIGRVVPIDPVLAIVGDRAPAHVVERVRQEMGFNLPYYQQFLPLCERCLARRFRHIGTDHKSGHD